MIAFKCALSAQLLKYNHDVDGVLHCYSEVPSELLAQAQGREISFNMEDFRHTTYVHTGPKVASFAGTGQKLGR